MTMLTLTLTRAERTLPLALCCCALLGLATPAWAGGDAKINGNVNVYNGGTVDSKVKPQGSNAVVTKSGSLPKFVYKTPAAGQANTTYVTYANLGAARTTAPNGNNTKTNNKTTQEIRFNNAGGAGTTTVYTFAAGDIATAVSDRIVVDGGGTVIIHIQGNLAMVKSKFRVEGGTKIAFFTDGNFESRWVNYKQSSGTGSLQVQARGNVTFRVKKFKGIAYANGTLSLKGNLDKIKGDASKLGETQIGNVKTLKVLPIVEGD